MAFCNSCGAALDAGTKFCNKCGAAVAAAPAAPAVTPMASAPAPVPASTGGGGALKIVLIVIAIIVGLGILSVGAFSFFVYRIAHSAHVSQNGEDVKIDTPFGSVNSSKDPAQVAKDLGVDIYPGAEAQKNGNATMTFGNVRTVTASFTSGDALDKVCDFYKSKFPNAMTTSADQNRCTVISNDHKNMITIALEAHGDTTKITISNVTKKSSD
ncbi:MAG TPA: zinc ribbon domain-containing protein [Candidatus Sulfotelmatobacter sp.]|jgi:hypothetical protein